MRYRAWGWLVSSILFVACSAPTDDEASEASSFALGAQPPGSEPPLDPCLTQPAINPWLYCGDLTINGQADANLHAAVRSVHGNLKIIAGRTTLRTSGRDGVYKSGKTFSMPNLRSVSGNVTLDTDRAETVTLSHLASIGGDLSLTMRYFKAAASFASVDSAQRTTSVLSTPALTKVGGNILLTPKNDWGLDSFHNFYDFGLGQVVTLGGGVKLVNETNAGPSGLAALVDVPGGVEIDWPGAYDLVAGQFLPEVEHVGGDLYLRTITFTDTLMQSLTHVSGSVTIEDYRVATAAADPSHQAGLRNDLFGNLATIDGDLTLRQARPVDCAHPQLKSLGTVGGTIRIIGAVMHGPIGKTGPGSLLAGGVEITSSSGSYPFFPDLQLTPSATVVVHDNPDLCPPAIVRLQTNLTAAGWSGTVQSSNNNVSCVDDSHC